MENTKSGQIQQKLHSTCFGFHETKNDIHISATNQKSHDLGIYSISYLYIYRSKTLQKTKFKLKIKKQPVLNVLKIQMGFFFYFLLGIFMFFTFKKKT